MKECESCGKQVKKLFPIYYFGLACSCCFVEWYEYNEDRKEQLERCYNAAKEDSS